jgi:hypothetical protein
MSTTPFTFKKIQNPTPAMAEEIKTLWDPRVRYLQPFDLDKLASYNGRIETSPPKGNKFVLMRARFGGLIGRIYVYETEAGCYLRPLDKVTRREFETLFGFFYRCDDFDLDRVVFWPWRRI